VYSRKELTTPNNKTKDVFELFPPFLFKPALLLLGLLRKKRKNKVVLVSLKKRKKLLLYFFNFLMLLKNIKHVWVQVEKKGIKVCGII
jgi:hypothetical protein